MLDELRHLIGRSAVVASPEILAGYAEDASGGQGAVPMAVVRPQGPKELQTVIRWARKSKVPLVPVSSAQPHHRADTLLERAGVVVDLSLLKKIVLVNRRNRVALFEAGVTFAELAAAVRAEGLRLLLPLLPRAGKSALSAYLEREPSILPRYQWDLSDPLLCLDLVWGTGDEFRTGSAAGPGTLEEQWKAGDFQKNPMGPGQNDWMRLVQGAQGSMAIVRQCSAKCEAAPAMEELFLVPSDTPEPLIQASYAMFRRKLTEIHFLVDENALSRLIMRGEEPPKKAAQGATRWYLVFTVSGLGECPEERFRFYKKRTAEILRERGLSPVEPPSGTTEDLLALLGGVSPEPYWKTRPWGGMREVFFLTTMDQVPRFLSVFSARAADAGIPPSRVATYLQPLLGGRLCHLEFIIGFSPHDRGEAQRAQAFADTVVVPLLKAGAFFSRPYGKWTQPVMSSSSTTPVLRRVKTVFDPDGILSPGRLQAKGD